MSIDPEDVRKVAETVLSDYIRLDDLTNTSVCIFCARQQPMVLSSPLAHDTDCAVVRARKLLSQIKEDGMRYYYVYRTSTGVHAVTLDPGSLIVVDEPGQMPDLVKVCARSVEEARKIGEGLV